MFAFLAENDLERENENMWATNLTGWGGASSLEASGPYSAQNVNQMLQELGA